MVYRSAGRQFVLGRAGALSTVHRSVGGAFVELRLIEIRIVGYYEPKKWDFGSGYVGQGKASRFYARPELLARAAEHGINAGATRSHFRRTTGEQVIVLKAKSMRQGGSKVKGRKMKVPETRRRSSGSPTKSDLSMLSSKGW